MLLVRLPLVLVLVLVWCGRTSGFTECVSLKNAYNERFEMVYEWRYLNYTWPSVQAYHAAVAAGRYVPENNAIVGVKYHGERLYLALPKAKPGSPVTLAYVPLTPEDDVRRDVLLTPYPSWEMNTAVACAALHNVQSMEVDRKGIMWVLDGRRIDRPAASKCPPKIVLLDLNAGGRVLQTYTVPANVCPADACFLNDIVIEELDGGYAYITDTGTDPGLVVYSRWQNRAWKVRDGSMHAQQSAAVGLSARGLPDSVRVPVDGIAMAPQAGLDDPDRTVYYTALSGLDLYGINSSVLRDEGLATSAAVAKHIVHLGPKFGPSDGMVMDSDRQLYYGVLNQDAVAKWDLSSGPGSHALVDQNPDLLLWPDSFGFDHYGSLYLVANNIGHFLHNAIPTDRINFRLLKLYTGTCSYQF